MLQFAWLFTLSSDFYLRRIGSIIGFEAVHSETPLSAEVMERTLPDYSMRGRILAFEHGRRDKSAQHVKTLTDLREELKQLSLSASEVGIEKYFAAGEDETPDAVSVDKVLRVAAIVESAIGIEEAVVKDKVLAMLKDAEKQI